jgi:ferredoxin
VKVHVDLARCEGYANCVMEAERVFDIDDASGQAVVLLPVLPAEHADEVRRAEASCPVQAILVEG